MTPTTILLSRGVSVDLAKPEEFQPLPIHVIAQSLSQIARYTGHAKPKWTVGMHSLLVARLLETATVEPRFWYEGLCHDMLEAVIGDDATPKKKAVPELLEFELRWDKAIRSAYNLPQDMSRVVSRADAVALHMEMYLFLGEVPERCQCLTDLELVALFKEHKAWMLGRAHSPDQFIAMSFETAFHRLAPLAGVNLEPLTQKEPKHE